MSTKKFLLLMFGLLLGLTAWAQGTTQRIDSVSYTNSNPGAVPNVLPDKEYNGLRDIAAIAAGDLYFGGEAGTNISTLVRADVDSITAMLDTKDVGYRKPVIVTVYLKPTSIYSFKDGTKKYSWQTVITVNPSKTLRFQNATVANKEYDGNKTATISSAFIKGLGTDTLRLDTDFTAVAEFSAKDAATYTNGVKVVATLKTPLTALASNYAWAAVTDSNVTNVTAAITPKPITVTNVILDKTSWAFAGPVPGSTPAVPDSVVFSGLVGSERLRIATGDYAAVWKSGTPPAPIHNTIGSYTDDSVSVTLGTTANALNYRLNPSPAVKSVAYRITKVLVPLAAVDSVAQYSSTLTFNGRNHTAWLTQASRDTLATLGISIAAAPADSMVLSGLNFPTAGTTYTIQQGSLALNDPNYEIAFTQGSIRVDKAPITINVTSASFTYDGTVKALVYDTVAPMVLTGAPEIKKDGVVVSQIKDAGIYTVAKGTLSLGNNYDLTLTQATVTVNKRLVTVKPPTGIKKAKEDEDPDFTYTVVNRAFADSVAGKAIVTGKLVYANQNNYANKGINSPVGTHLFLADSLKIAATDSLNYAFATPRIAAADADTFEITRRKLIVTPKAGLKEEYGTATANRINLKDSANYTIRGNREMKPYEIPGFTPFTAGSEPELVRVPGDSIRTYNFTGINNFASTDYDFELDKNNTNQFEIVKGTIFYSPGAQTIVYGDTLPDNPFKAAAAFKGFSDSSAPYGTGRGDNYNLADIKGKVKYVGGVNVGTHGYDVSDLSHKNYVFKVDTLTAAVKVLNITQAQLTVKADSATKVYGGVEPDLSDVSAFTISGWKYNDSISAASILTGAATYPGMGNARTPVGTYNITQGTVAIAAPANYFISFHNGIMEITRATLQLAAVDTFKVYGENDPALKYGVVSGLATGDVVTGLVSGTLTRDTRDSITGLGPQDAGKYIIRQGTLALNTVGSPNYTLKVDTAVFTIKKASLSIIPPAGKSAAYNAAIDSISVSEGTPQSADLKYGETLASAYLTGKFGIDATVGSPIGEYTFNKGSITALNYEPVVLNTPKFEITAAALKITLVPDKNDTITYGDPLALDFVVASPTSVPKPGDYLALANATPDPLSLIPDAGTYTIVADSLKADNYAISFTTVRTLTVKKAALTEDDLKIAGVDSLVYDGNGHTATVGFAETGKNYTGVTTTILKYVASNGTETNAPVNADNYDMYVRVTVSATATNFTAATDTFIVPFVIAQAPLKVTPVATGKKVGAADPALEYETNPAGVRGTGALVRDPGEEEGEYAIKIGTLNFGTNYRVEFVDTIKFTIGDKIAITVQADDKRKTYGESDAELTYTITRGALEAGDRFEGELTRQYGDNAGTYAITRGSLTAGDKYALTFINGTYTIDKAPQTIVFAPLPDDVTVATGSIVLEATVNSPLALTFTSSNTAVATVSSHGVVAIKSVGETVITVSQSGDSNHEAATSVSRTLVVTPGTAISSVEGGVKVYPSPALKNSSLSVEVNDGALYGKATIEVYNTAGKLIDATPVKSRITTLTAPEVSGTYVYVLKTKEGISKTIKVLVK